MEVLLNSLMMAELPSKVLASHFRFSVLSRML